MPIEAEAPEQIGYERIRANLTESSVRDRSLRELGVALDDLSLCYSDHLGHTGLRELVAHDAGSSIGRDEVMLTAGASAALFTVAMALLDKGDHVIVVRPNYATNIETPRVLQCEVDLVDLDFDQAYALDPARIEALARPGTKLISITSPHNPTGVALSRGTVEALIALAERLDIHLLVDETYRDLSFVPPLPVAASLSRKAISVSSLSKAYGIPGIRLGWVVSRDPALMQQLLCVKEQIGICGSVVDEAIGYHAYAARGQWLPQSQRQVRAAFAQVRDWLAREPRLEWIEPGGGCVCFPRIRADTRIDPARFYHALNHDHGTYVGRGHWFEQSDRYFRLGYGWPTRDELGFGLGAITLALDAASA